METRVPAVFAAIAGFYTILIFYRTHAVLKRNFALVSACDGLAALTAHIPNTGEHLVRYDGWYRHGNEGSGGRPRATSAGASRNSARALHQL